MRNKSRKIQTFVMNKGGLRFSWNIIDISNENIVAVLLIEVVPHQSKMLPLIHSLCIRVLIFFLSFQLYQASTCPSILKQPSPYQKILNVWMILKLVFVEASVEGCIWTATVILSIIFQVVVLSIAFISLEACKFLVGLTCEQEPVQWDH